MTYIIVENKDSTQLIKAVNGLYLQALYINGAADATH